MDARKACQGEGVFGGYREIQCARRGRLAATQVYTIGDRLSADSRDFGAGILWVIIQRKDIVPA